MQKIRISLVIVLSSVLLFIVSGCSKMNHESGSATGNASLSGQSTDPNTNENSALSGVINQINGNTITFAKTTTKITGGQLTTNGKKDGSDDSQFKINDHTVFVVRTSHDYGKRVDPDKSGSKDDLKVNCYVNVWGKNQEGSFVATKVLITVFEN